MNEKDLLMEIVQSKEFIEWYEKELTLNQVHDEFQDLL